MTLKEQFTQDLHAAMRSGDERRKIALRSLITAVKNSEIATGKELDDDGVIGVVGREVRQRKESIEEFRKAGRQDLVEKEQAELEVLSAYMPEQMSREDIEAAVRAVIAETGAKSPADKAKVMPVLMNQLRGRADGREINEVVTQLLQQGQ
jgi:uncharacterized protein YqeY